MTKSYVNRNSTSQFTGDRFRTSLYNRAVPQYAFSNVNRSVFGNAAAPRQKPFSSIGGGPSVTPYLALSSPFSSTATNYYTQVKPMLEQQRINQQMQAQSLKVQQQLTSIAARPPFDPQGSEMRAPTGHVAVYMNYGGYYTVAPPRQRK